MTSVEELFYFLKSVSSKPFGSFKKSLDFCLSISEEPQNRISRCKALNFLTDYYAGSGVGKDGGQSGGF